jgi:parvulin-like peptidyl-prolyl isomerase
MVERIRTEIQRIRTGEGGGERMSQAELDSYRRQLVLLVVTVTTVALILILGIGAYYQYIHLPRQSVATVNDETISRSDYWDFRQYELLNQINQYQQFAQMMEGDQGQQYQQLAFEANQEFEDIEDADIDPMTVNEMITNRILRDALDDFGLEITDEEIDDRLVEFFTGMPISQEPDGPSADPTAEAWATATVEAQEAEAEDAEAEGESENGDSASEDEENASEDEDADPSDEADGEGDESDAEEADESEAEPTPEPEPTPSDAEMRETAEANQSDHEEFLLDRAGISHDDFVEMFIVPDIAREKIRNHLAEDVPTRAEHVQAAHILVATQDAAQVVYEELSEDGADFAEVAEEQSTDQQTAPNGGDLGWFPRGVMVEEFDEVIFELEPGEVSEPFQTDFGWHIATVTDREEDRPIELNVLDQQRQQVFDEWLEEQREAADIETDHELPEDPSQQQQDQFQPPAGAPHPPQPEMDPEMDVQQEIPVGDDESEDVFDGDDPFADSEDEDDD